MFENYIKYAFRRLRKNWRFTSVNVLGLATGIAIFFLIFFYVHFESTYDRFIPDAKDKYRVVQRIANNVSEWNFAQIAAPVATALKDRYPQVDETVRFASANNRTVSYLDRVFQENQILYADPSFIPFFGLRLLSGDPKNALSRPQTILITEAVAIKYFGDDDPLGRSLKIEDTHFEVTGIIPDAPINSHLAYRFIASIDLSDPDLTDTKSNWTKKNYYTYVQLSEGTDHESFEEQIRSLANLYGNPEGKLTGWDFRYSLQKVTEIHLHSKLAAELKPPGDSTNLVILAIIGSFVFFIACFNFVNLSTAQSIKRATEVGIRKVTGATRDQLVLQFTGESVLVFLFALILAVGFTMIIFPSYRNLVNLPLQSRDILKPIYLAFLGFLTLVAGMGAGSYPAFFMARFDPERILRGVLPSGFQALFLRKTLITFQFVIASLLIICALLINRQIIFMKNQQNFGFETDRRLVLRISGGKYPISGERVQALKDEFAKHSNIERVSASTTIPGRDMIENSMRKRDETWESAKRQIRFLGIDYEFLSQYRIELAAGRTLDKTQPADQIDAVLINESAAKDLGWSPPTEALNREIVLGGSNAYRIIGVVEDFHYTGLQSPIEPLILQHFLARNFPIGYFTLTVKPENLSETVGFLERTWAQIFPEYPFEYFFLDDDFKRFYAREERLSQMISALTILGILITCLGLWGLSSLSTEQRIKEIGIRKILGASAPGIIVLMTKEFAKWVLMANLFAWPLGYFIMRDWLQNFAYRIRITPDIFILSALMALVFALITVSLQTNSVAQANPVDSLRHE